MNNTIIENGLKNVNNIVIHAGVMHADDVFTVAYINLVRKWFNLKPANVIRTFAIKPEYKLENGYLVADIGGGEFNHHFPDNLKQKRSDGVPYAAFGLVVREFHQEFFNEYEYELFDRKFIKPLDYHDNNGSGNQLAFVIGSFNKNWDEECNCNADLRFMKAVEFATIALEQYICSIRSLAKAKAIAEQVEVDGETIYLDKFAPISEFFADDEQVKFIGSPSLRNGYQIVAVKNREGKNKKLFPEYLRGFNPGDGIYNETGVNFCHSSGFICVFKDKATAKEFMDIFKNMN